MRSRSSQSARLETPSRRTSYAQSVAPFSIPPKMSMFAALKLSEYSSDRRSVSSISSVRAYASAKNSRLRCVWMTPLGWPVEPDV